MKGYLIILPYGCSWERVFSLKNEYLPSKEDPSPQQESMPLITFAEDTAVLPLSLCPDPTLMEQSSGFNLTTRVAFPQGKNMLTTKCRHLVYLK